MLKPFINSFTFRKIAAAASCTVALSASVSNAGDIGLVDFYQDGLNGFESVECSQGTAISPDGLMAYSVGYCDEAINIFSRDGVTGQLTPIGAVLADDKTGTGVHAKTFIFMHPSGKYLYTLGTTGIPGSKENPYFQGVFMFQRDAATGEIALMQSVERTSGKPDWRGHMSSDGHYLYVGGQAGIDVFKIAGNGFLSEVQKVRELSKDTHLPFPQHMAFSPDESLVYVVTNQQTAIVWLLRDAITGELTYQGELAIDSPASGADIKNINEVSVSSDGKYLYVSGTASDNLRSLTHFRIGESGELTYAGVNNSAAIRRAIPGSIYASENNEILYMASGGTFQAWGRDVETGEVGFLALSEDGEDGLNPYALSQVDQSNISADGKFAYVSVNGGITAFQLAVDLSTKLTGVPSDIEPGKRSEFELEVLNTSTTAAHNVVVDTAISGASQMEFLGASNPELSCEVTESSILKCSMPSLTSGGAEYLRFAATADASAEALEMEITTRQSEVDLHEDREPYAVKFDFSGQAELEPEKEPDAQPKPQPAPAKKKKSGGSLSEFLLVLAGLSMLTKLRGSGVRLKWRRTS